MKLIKITVAALAAMLVSLGVYAQAPEKFNEAVEKANAKEFVTAASLLEEAVKLGEEAGADGEEVVREAKKMMPQVYFLAGGGLAQAQKADEAIVYFEKAVKAAEEVENVSVLTRAKDWVARTYIMMGATAFNNKDYKAAAEIFQKGYDVNPNNPELSLFLAQSYGEMGEYEKAYDAFRGVIALQEHGDKYAKNVEKARETMAYYMLINANDIAASKPAQAIEILSESVGVKADPQAYMLLIQTANNSKNFNKVIEFGDKAAEAQSDAALKSTAYFFVGAAYDNKGDQGKAVEYYKKVTSGPQAAAAKSQIAAIQAAQG